ncbi:MAG: DUF3394 domain-containing protein, partial [Gammaproteobacteria bacterium]
QGFMFTRNKKWESALLLLIAFTLFRPGYWLDKIAPPYDIHQPDKVYEVVDGATVNGVLTVVVSGPDFDTGEMASTTILVNLGEPMDAIERLRKAGLTVTVEDGRAVIEEPFPGTPFFESIGKSFDYYGDQPVQIAEVRTAAERMPKEVFYIPAALLLALIIMLQKRRAREEQGSAATAPA